MRFLCWGQGQVSSDGGTKEQAEITSVGGVGLGTEDKMVENDGGRWEVPSVSQFPVMGDGKIVSWRKSSAWWDLQCLMNRK